MGLFRKGSGDIPAGNPHTVNPPEKKKILQNEAEKPKKYKIPLNPTSTDVRRILGQLVFSCPSCEGINTIPIPDVDPIMGAELMCMNCQNMLHIPGGYVTGECITDLKVYAAIPVTPSKFPIFYWNHPVIRSITEKGLHNIIIQYGLWAFCQKCHHQFSPAVLTNLPQEKCIVVDSRVLNSDEVLEMNALRKGFCPFCHHRMLLSIISEIPGYIISASDDLSHRWDDE